MVWTGFHGKLGVHGKLGFLQMGFGDSFFFA